MMKRFMAFGLSNFGLGILGLSIFASLSLVSLSVNAQQRVDITSFEGDDISLTYSGTNIPLSLVDFGDAVPIQDGEQVLVVEYQATGPWNWSQINFPSKDISGMREIHIWAYFDEGWVGDTTIRIDLAGGVGLGTRDANGVTGEWVELVWTIDRFTSETLSDVSYFGGFIAPGDETAVGTLYIDNIFAMRPAGVPEVETVSIYGFNAEDPNTGTAVGWQDRNGAGLVSSDIPSAEGAAYLELQLGDGWTENVATSNALADFDRWIDVVDIQLDARVSSGFTGGWVQYDIVIQTGADGVDGVWGQLPEQGFAEAIDNWKTLIWQVDMEQHRAALEGVNPWMNIIVITNNDTAVAGQLVYLDNFRIGVKVDDTNVAHWSLY